MTNDKLKYQYRDYANYKKHGELILSNPENLNLREIEVALRSTCMDDEYFLAGRWRLPDLHFEKWDDENDHPWHQFVGLEVTEEPSAQNMTVGELLIHIKQWDNCYY